MKLQGGEFLSRVSRCLKLPFCSWKWCVAGSVPDEASGHHQMGPLSSLFFDIFPVMLSIMLS